MQKTSPRVYTVQYIIYVFIVAHFKRWLTSTLSHLDCSFQQRFTTGKKLEESKSVIQPFGIFWTCSRQDWDLSFQSPSFSAVFPPFSGVFCPLNFLFSMFFLAYLYSSYNCCCIHFGCLLERCYKCMQMPKSNKQFQ